MFRSVVQSETDGDFMDAEVPNHETASTAYAWGPKSRIQASSC
jgi:hypothetical protein